MSRSITSGEGKALLRELVKAAGGVEAVAVELNVSHQRVSQYQSPGCTDFMPFLCIVQLEAIVGRAIVTGAACRAIEGEGSPAISAAAVEAVTSTATTLRLVSDMDADGARNEAEIRSVRRATQENLKVAEKLADAAAQLAPGRVG